MTEPASPGPRAGLVLGVDPGERRVGVAAADLETRVAVPVEVIDATVDDPVSRVAAIAAEKSAQVIVVGRPTGLSGAAGPAVERQQLFVEQLRNAAPVPVVEFDERLTSVVAQQGLRAGGGRRNARSKIVDAVAAQVMLQGYVDALR